MRKGEGRRVIPYLDGKAPAFLQRTSVRDVRGTTILTPEPNTKEIHAETRQCVHCGMHFEIVPGSGTRRGYCMACGGVTCGQKIDCETRCQHFESKIEQMEREGRSIDTRGAVLL